MKACAHWKPLPIASGGLYTVSLLMHPMLLFVVVCLSGSFGELIPPVTEISPWYLIDD